MKTDSPDASSRRASQAYRKLVALPNAVVSTDSMMHDMVASTALLTDGISTIPYYCTTGKPLGVTRRRGTWQYLDASGKALAALADQLHTRRQTRNWLRKACQGRIADSPDRRMLVSRLFPVHSTSPGQHLLDRLN